MSYQLISSFDTPSGWRNRTDPRIHHHSDRGWNDLRRFKINLELEKIEKSKEVTEKELKPLGHNQCSMRNRLNS